MHYARVDLIRQHYYVLSDSSKLDQRYNRLKDAEDESGVRALMNWNLAYHKKLRIFVSCHRKHIYSVNLLKYEASYRVHSRIAMVAFMMLKCGHNY